VKRENFILLSLPTLPTTFNWECYRSIKKKSLFGERLKCEVENMFTSKIDVFQHLEPRQQDQGILAMPLKTQVI
jgi:hypothetical protein